MRPCLYAQEMSSKISHKIPNEILFLANAPIFVSLATLHKEKSTAKRDCSQRKYDIQ